MDEKVRVQLSYDPTDELTQKAIIMLESAMRSKSQLVALALCEFADKYGFQIDNTEEIKAVIKNYDYLSRAMMSDAGSMLTRQIPIFGLTPASAYQKKEKPKKAVKKAEKSQSIKMIPCEEPSAKVEIAEEVTLSSAPESGNLGFEEDIVVSDRAMQSMNNVLAMFTKS